MDIATGVTGTERMVTMALIEREAAIKAITGIDAHGNADRANALGLAEFQLTTLPAVDAVPVMRCKNCKMLYMKKDIFGKVPWCKAWHRQTIETMFCGWGKRRDGKDGNDV